MGLIFPIILAVTAVVAWWLSGYDTRVTGENQAADLKRRAVRCGVTLLVVALGVGAAWGGGRFGGFVFLATVVPLALIWAGCVGEMFARGFYHLIDSPDPTEFDPKKLSGELDALAVLVKQGRNEEAIGLCTELLKSGEASGLAMEAMLFRLYDELFDNERILRSPSLAEAQRWCEQGNGVGAEPQLKELLKREPGNLPAAIMLMRIYARNFRRPDKACTLLTTFEDRFGVLPGFMGYARRRIDGWLSVVPLQKKSAEGVESLLVEKAQRKAPEEPVLPPEASVAELLSAGRLGTAIEILESKLERQPQDFNSWLQLAEAHACYCGSLERAAKILARLETNPAFSPEQIRQAKAKLQEWRARGSVGGR